MNYFAEVTVVTDVRFAEIALGIRGLLEAFHLKVNFIRLVQKRHCLAFFGGEVQTPAALTVLACHGLTTDEGEPAMRSECVDNPDPDPKAVTGWEPVSLDLTPRAIRILVRAQGDYITLACGGGRESLAQAFLGSGADSYIGATSDYIDLGASILFLATLLYFLLAEDRDLAPKNYSLEQAVERAAGLDTGWPYGTESFRLYRRADAVNR
jgi:hypothetical protein